MYSLEKRALVTGSRPTWKQYALCGSRFLLEQIREAQKRPEEWRIVRIPDAASNCFSKAS